MKYDSQFKGDFSGLEADLNFKAFVGPPDLYDFMGASQFALLFTLGLRAHHRLLDFGCGSLRAGKFFLNYLNENCYYGVEPNQWLIEQGIKTELGNDLINIKKPSFHYNSDFSIDGFSTTFDFIIAQSIFSHTEIDLVRKGFQNFSPSLSQNGIIAATFVEGPVDSKGSEWIYPEVVTFRRSTIKKLAQEAGLVSTPIPWYHPFQTWYIFSKNKNRLPSPWFNKFLHGAVILDPGLKSSWNTQARLTRYLRNLFRRFIPPNIQRYILYKGLRKKS